MDKLNSMTARQLSNLDIQGIKVAEPYGTLLGEPEVNAVMFIWGEKGAGKSTFSLGLANALARHGRVEYIPAEEHFGKTLVDRVRRLGATHTNLNFTRWKSVEALKDTLRKNKAVFCVLDSITVIEANDKATVELAQWCRQSGIGFIMVAHATKDGKYKGNTSIAHECDIEIKVTLEGMAETEKNRYRTLTAIAVPFTAKQIRSNPGVKPLTKQQHAGVSDSLSNDESSSDEELVTFWKEELGLSEAQARHWIAKRGKFLRDPLHDESRFNPVEVPFRITLAEINKLHKIRSWKRVNSMLGSKMPCYGKKHSGESETAHLSVRYTPDYNNKKYVLELLLDGRLEAQICTEGAKGGFKQSWKKLVDEHGDLEVMIYSQDHAKKVLGAKEYKRQERSQAVKPDCPPDEKPKKSKPAKPKKAVKRKKKKPARKKTRKPKTAKTDPGRDQAVADGLRTAASELKKISGSIDTSSAYASYELEDKAIIMDLIGHFDQAISDNTHMRTIASEAIDSYYDLFHDQFNHQDLKLRTTSVIEDLDKVLQADAASRLKEIAKQTDRPSAKSKPAKKKTKRKTSAGRKKTSRSKPEKKAKSSDGIDIEAARRSQSKLDTFLEKVLS